MASVNKVILLGNCGRDPEIRHLTSGQAVANISIATSTRRKNKDTGETTDSTEWHRVVFYDRLAEICGEHVKKGKSIYVEGRLKYGKYTDQAGVEKHTRDIVATELQLLGGKEDDVPRSRTGTMPRQESPKPSHDAAKARELPKQASGFDDMSDDIPF